MNLPFGVQASWLPLCCRVWAHFDRSKELNGLASAKYPKEPVSLMELRVTKRLKYHGLEQEGPVWKEWAYTALVL